MACLLQTSAQIQRLKCIALVREKVRSPFGQLGVSRHGGRVELQSTAHAAPPTAHREVHVLADLENGALVAAAVAVVGRGEHRDDVLVVAPVEALAMSTPRRTHLHHHLMGARDQADAIRLVELATDVLAECVASAAGGHTPTLPIVRIRPEKIGHRPFVAVKGITQSKERICSPHRQCGRGLGSGQCSGWRERDPRAPRTPRHR